MILSIFNIYARLGLKGDIRPTMDVREPEGRVRREKASVLVLRNWYTTWQGIKATGNLTAFAEEAERELAGMTVPARPKASVTELLPRALVAYRRMVRDLPNAGDDAGRADRARKRIRRPGRHEW